MHADTPRLDLTVLLSAEAHPRAAAPFTPPQRPRSRRRGRDQQPKPLPVRRARPLPKPGGVR
ncbi:hypothetical protein SUDANB121_00936 [Nocardiopsis dassonvillei]|uniref:hypothetical protein n=1 Tax=Nocardiopsis dassonvillei TaxID=2014 RepID=UPI003F57E203